jgi:hypothetical protein
MTMHNSQEIKYVTRRRAAVLLGMSEEQLAEISSETGLGHTERAGQEEETFFTYEELRQICQVAVHHVN